MSLSTYYLEYGRHLARLRRRRRRGRAYAPTSNTASHDNHEKIHWWVSLDFHIRDAYGAPLGGPSGRRSSAINVFLLVVGCSVLSIRLDVTWWMAASAGVWVSKVPSCWRLPILLLWGVSGINCMSGWLADCGLFTMIPASCKLFWTAAAMVIPKFANQSALTLLAPCAGGGFVPDGLCKFYCAAECAVSWLGWGLFPSTRRLWAALVT